MRRDSSPTDKIIFSVCRPIQSMSPSSESASIKTNSAAKNSKVDHSTRASTASMSSLKFKLINIAITQGAMCKSTHRSDNMSNNMAPSRAVQPSDKRCRFGTECRKKKLMTKISVIDDLMSNLTFLIGYFACKSSNVAL